jgi:RNA polymerase sigma factor (sigma-70 family)
MRPDVKRYRPVVFLLNAVDRLGRTIDPTVLSAASEIAPRALLYAERLIGDPALAMDLFEEAAATVSVVMEQKKNSDAPAVRNLPAYLFRTFIRMVSDSSSRNPTLEESLDEIGEEYGGTQNLISEMCAVESTILLNEIMETCDRVSREVVVRRLEGFSWKEIGTQFGISTHAAEARFSKALDHARKKLRIRGEKG